MSGLTLKPGETAGPFRIEIPSSTIHYLVARDSALAAGPRWRRWLKRPDPDLLKIAWCEYAHETGYLKQLLEKEMYR